MTRTTLATIRSKTYKPRDSWWTVWLVDPLASRLVWLVAPIRQITPNLITFTAFVVGLGSAYAFWQADRTGLMVGALLFHVSFVLDCMDGKIARLNGTGTTFGSWLDYIFDRLRVLACTVALFGGQYQLTEDFIYIWLGGAALFMDMFRGLNNLQMNQVWAQIRGGEAPNGVDSDEDGSKSSLRGFLARHRLRPHLFGGIEMMMFVFIIGPILDQVVAVTFGSLALMLVFEALQVVYLYRGARQYERTQRMV